MFGVSTVEESKKFTSAVLNPRDALANRLLEKLPEEEYQRLLPSLEFVDLTVGEFLYHSGDEIKHLYFPTGAIVSLLYTTENGATAEMGMAGRCGAVGIASFMGGKSTPNQAVVQIAGGAFRIKAQILRDEFNRGGVVQMLLLRYTQSLHHTFRLIALKSRILRQTGIFRIADLTLIG